MASRKIMVIFYQNAMQQASNVIGKFREFPLFPLVFAQMIGYNDFVLPVKGRGG